ncbi:uncharacterized protein DDB_G0286379-like [Sitodiplosis mosellana]|uniref:uncharacterized protein DDB_G0286379-like n=1 Tax=Sitodiplosis mosellana TaxID=263140 RepID=UPI002444FCC9|nr:uncharacterized protein DDB_G0286379-like [Sitodiplosis mosellana]
MIVAFIAIAGLLLSNKDDVVRFINKHNINWFERNLVSQQINKQHNKGTIYHSVSDSLKAASSSSSNSNSNSNSNKLIAFGNEAHDKNAIHLMDDVMVSQTPVKVPNQLAPPPPPPPPPPAVAATVIAITNPPIVSEEITTQYAWKSLINKIVNSNKNELVAVNSVGIVDKVRSTVASSQLFKVTTNATPTKTTTLAPVQHESTLESVRNDMLKKKPRMQNEEPNKANDKLPNTIKPYWYIDPSIVYRAMTSPINPSDHSASFIFASLLFVICLFFFLYCVMTDKLCGRCCCTRKRIKIKTENEIHEVNTTLLANHEYNNSSDDD